MPESKKIDVAIYGTMTGAHGVRPSVRRRFSGELAILMERLIIAGKHGVNLSQLPDGLCDALGKIGIRVRQQWTSEGIRLGVENVEIVR
jgi:hypothetical protein